MQIPDGFVCTQADYQKKFCLDVDSKCSVFPQTTYDQYY